jgi:autotransporter-associated beta strand protein
MKRLPTLLTSIAALLSISSVQAETWNLAAGGSWNSTASWSPTSIPNATGATAIFNGATTANNPDQTANRTITLDGAKTVGSIVFNNDLSTFSNTISTGTGTPPNLIFNNGGSGATITTTGSGTGNNTIAASFRLDDNLTAHVNNTTATSSAGSLTFTTGNMTGTGGFTKDGDGMVTFSSNDKTYTGPTAINGGRMRMSAAGITGQTSSFTINSGGQLDLISAGSHTLGTGALNLNGSGPATGPFAIFPGAIRPDRGLDIIITNTVVLQSDALIHVEASNTPSNPLAPVGKLTFSSSVSGPGKLAFTAPNSDVDAGTLLLTAANSYTGGTLVRGGIVDVQGAGTLGAGNVTVDNSTSPLSIARVNIEAGTANAINNLATLILAGGGAANAADQNFAILGAGVNEIVGGLVLGGTTETVPGTYGSTSSLATFQFDEYFSGSGVITLAPPAGVPGDYNNNGKVDAADYVLWRKGGTLANDPTPGNQLSDYDFWRARFGNPPGSGSGLGSCAVPEPGTIAILTAVVPLLGALRFRNQAIIETKQRKGLKYNSSCPLRANELA